MIHHRNPAVNDFDFDSDRAVPLEPLCKGREPGASTGHPAVAFISTKHTYNRAEQ